MREGTCSFDLYIVYLCMHLCIYLLVYLFIYLFLNSLPSWPIKRKGLGYWKTFTSSYQLSLLQWFISARFPTLQTITGTRLHVLSLTDVLCTHVGTLQVISL